jgi:hypothetical protein
VTVTVTTGDGDTDGVLLAAGAPVGPLRAPDPVGFEEHPPSVTATARAPPISAMLLMVAAARRGMVVSSRSRAP